MVRAARSGRRTVVGIALGMLLVLAQALLAVPASATTTTGSADSSGKGNLRVLTFNIHHGAGTDDVLDLEHVATVIEESGAQVVALQEVDRHWGERSDFVDQAAWLGERLGMRSVYGANLDEAPVPPATERRQYGTAILSAYPITSWTNTPLPKFEGGEQRGLLEAHLDVGGTPVRVFNTHLQHDNAAERQAQADAIVDRIGRSRRPALLMGDLNAVPDTPEIATLTRRLTDVWARVGDGDGFTIPVEAPDRRIDYVLTTPSLQPVSAEVIATDASDHLPVAAALNLDRATG